MCAENCPESRVETCEETFPWRIADRVGMKVKNPPVYSEENRRVLSVRLIQCDTKS
jgi:hypothetical protein